MSTNQAYLRLTTFCTLVVVGILSSTQSVCAQCSCGSSAIGAPYSSMTIGMSDEMMMGMYGQLIEGDAIYLTVNVPEKAILQINGDPTISIGPTRYFVIRNLEPDEKYKFVIVVETANAAGVAMEETQTLKLKPGARETVSLKPIRRKGAKPKPEAEDDGENKTARRSTGPLTFGH